MQHLPMGRVLSRRWWLPAVLGIVGVAAAADPIVVGQPVFDSSVGMFDGFKKDKVVGDFVFGTYGLGAFGSSNVFDTGPKFLGLSFDESQPIGGITSYCDPSGLTGCAHFGLKATLGGWGKFGTEYQLRAGGGTLDVRVPLRATLDLPYDATGGGVPTLGSTFTIGTSWTSSVKTLNQPGSGSKPVTTLLATHGPTVQAYADLIAELGASVSGKLCVGVCVSDSTPPLGFAQRWELGSVNRNGDGKFKVLDQQVTPVGEALNGIIKYELRLPKLDAQDKTLASSGLGGLLQTQAQDRVAKVELGIDELVRELTGVPISGEVGFDALGEHIGASYALIESSAGFDTLLKQRVNVQTVPTVTLDFASPVQKYLGNSGGVEQYGAPTQSLSFNLGESVSLRNTGASLLGGEARFGMMLVVQNELELQVMAKLSLEALKASTTLGGIGPLFGPESVSVPIGSIPLHQASFATSVADLGGLYFNMLFKLPELPLAFEPEQFATLGALDAAKWVDANGSALCGTRTTPDCEALAQTRFTGSFDLGAAPLPPCLFEPDGCAPSVRQELAERLQFALAAGPRGGQWSESAMRLLDDEGRETFLSALTTLDDPRLELGAGLDDEQFARDAAAMFAAVGTQRLETAPAPEPASVLLLGFGLAVLVLRRPWVVLAKEARCAVLLSRQATGGRGFA